MGCGGSFVLFLTSERESFDVTKGYLCISFASRAWAKSFNFLHCCSFKASLKQSCVMPPLGWLGQQTHRNRPLPLPFFSSKPHSLSQTHINTHMLLHTHSCHSPPKLYNLKETRTRTHTHRHTLTQCITHICNKIKYTSHITHTHTHTHKSSLNLICLHQHKTLHPSPLCFHNCSVECGALSQNSFCPQAVGCGARPLSKQVVHMDQGKYHCFCLQDL